MFIARGMHQTPKAPEGRHVAAGGVRRFIGALTRFLPSPLPHPRGPHALTTDWRSTSNR